MHFKCFNCNSIIDIDSQSLNFDYVRLNQVILRFRWSLKLNLIPRTLFIGLCSKCREELKCQGQQSLEE